MTRKILCVDDEENLLKAFERNLRGEFELETALAAPCGLEKLAEQGPYAVVVSDLRMPGMDGIQFLSEVRKHHPDTVRLILSGNADLTDAIAAVNQGSIFQFLTKPCPAETLKTALTAGLRQYQLIRAERELLEETLNASIGAITEVLGLSNPIAFGRASRVLRYVTDMVARLRTPNSWQFDLAAMLSQIGCIAVPNEILEKVNEHRPLLPEEQTVFTSHAAVGGALLAKIPRMETVAGMIRHQMTPAGELRAKALPSEVALGAQMLMVAIYFDDAVSRGIAQEQALDFMRGHPEMYEPHVVAVLENQKIAAPEWEIKCIYLRELRLDMILNQDLSTATGLFLAPKGQIVSPAFIARLKAFARSRGVIEPFSVLAPVSRPSKSVAFQARQAVNN